MGTPVTSHDLARSARRLDKALEQTFLDRSVPLSGDRMSFRITISVALALGVLALAGGATAQSYIEFSITTECESCHPEMSDVNGAFKGLGRKHVEAGLECWDCHMPFAAKSAVKFNDYKGDVRSHQFAITTDRNVEFLNPAGTLANGTLTGEWVCLGCHTNIQDKYAAKGKPEKAVDWARRGVKKIHR
jgi:hypothetical protein